MDNFEKIKFTDYIDEVSGMKLGFDLHEIYNYIKDSHVPFTEYEIHNIFNILTGINHRVLSMSDACGPGIEYEKVSDGFQKFFINITKMKDEWYYVNFTINRSHEQCYKCDQLSGLLECVAEISKKLELV